MVLRNSFASAESLKGDTSWSKEIWARHGGGGGAWVAICDIRLAILLRLWPVIRKTNKSLLEFVQLFDLRVVLPGFIFSYAFVPTWGCFYRKIIIIRLRIYWLFCRSTTTTTIQAKRSVVKLAKIGSKTQRHPRNRAWLMGQSRIFFQKFFLSFQVCFVLRKYLLAIELQDRLIIVSACFEYF